MGLKNQAMRDTLDSEGFQVGEEAEREEGEEAGREEGEEYGKEEEDGREEWEANLEDIQDGECMHDILHTLFDLKELEHDQVAFIYYDVQWNPQKMFLNFFTVHSQYLI